MRFYINEVYFFIVDVSVLFDVINFDYNLFDYNQRVKNYLHYSVFTGSTLFYYVNKFFYVKYSYGLYYDVIIWKRTWLNNFYSMYYYWDHLERPFRKIKHKCTRPIYMHYIYFSHLSFLDFNSIFYNIVFLNHKSKNLDFILFFENLVSADIYYCLSYYNNILNYNYLNQNWVFKIKIYFYLFYYFFLMIFVNLINVISLKLVNFIFLLILFNIYYLRKLYFFLICNIEELYELFVFEDDIYFLRMKILSNFFILNVKKYFILLNTLKYFLVHNYYFSKFINFNFSTKKNKNLLKNVLFEKVKNKNYLYMVFFVYFFFEIIFLCAYLHLIFKNFIIFIIDTLRFSFFVKFPFSGFFKKSSIGTEIKGDSWKVNKLNKYEIRFVSWFKIIFKTWFNKILKREPIAEELKKLKKDFKELSKKHSIFTRSYWKKWSKIKIEQENYAVFYEEDLVHSINYGFYQIYSLKNSIYFFFKNLNIRVIEFEFKNIIDKILIEILDFSLINWRFYIFEINIYFFFSYIYYFRIYFFFYYIYLIISIIEFFNIFIFKNYLLKLIIYYYLFFIFRIIKNNSLLRYFFNIILLKFKSIFLNFNFNFIDKIFFYIKLVQLLFFRISYYFINFYLLNKFFIFLLLFFLFYFFFDFNIIFFIFFTFLKLFYMVFYFFNEKLFNSFFFLIFNFNSYLNCEYFFYIICIKIGWSFDGYLYDLIPFYRFLYKEAVHRLEVILNTLQLLFSDWVQLVYNIYKSVRQWWKERGWTRRMKLKIYGRIIYTYYYLVYYFYTIFTYSFQITSKGIFVWMLSYIYFVFNWFYYFSYIFFSKLIIKNYYLFFLFSYFKYLFKIFILFILYFSYYLLKFLLLINFNMKINIFINFAYILKIFFYYIYFFINDVVIVIHNLVNYFLYLFMNIKFVSFYYFFWVDINLIWNNLLLKITIFYYELMKNIFQFEYLRFNFKKYRRVRKQRGAFRRFKRFYEMIFYYRDRGLLSYYHFKSYNLLYVHNFYLNNEIFKIKWYGLKQFWNYYIWSYFLLETWISYVIFLNVVLFLSLKIKREIKGKREGYLTNQDYSWQRINQDSLDKITPVEHFKLSSLEITQLEIISYTKNKGLNFNLEKVDFTEDTKIVNKTRMPERFTFKLVEKNRIDHFKHFTFFEEYFESRVKSYKNLIQLFFIKYIRGVRNRYSLVKDFNFNLLYNYYYKFENVNWILKEFSDTSPVMNYFLKNYLFFNLSSNVMFIDKEDFEKRKKFYNAFYEINENDKIHILDYKFGSEETYDHFISSGAFDEEKRITDYWSELANSYTQTFFLFSLPDKEYDYDFHKKVDKFFDKLYELDYYLNNTFFFTLYEYKNKYIQYKTRLSVDYIKEHFVKVLYDRKQFYTVDDTDVFPTEYLLKENIKKKIDLAYSYKDDDSYLSIIDKWSIPFSFWAIISFFCYFMFVNIFIIKNIWNKRLLFYIGFLIGYVIFFVKFFSKSLFFYYISSKFYYRRFWRKARKYSTYRINRVKLLNFYYSEQNFLEFIFYFCIYTFTFRMLDLNELFNVIFSTFLDLQLILIFMFSFSIWIFFFIFRWNGLFSKK